MYLENNKGVEICEICKVFYTLFARMEVQLFEQLEFSENPVYERVISDLLDHKYSIVDDYFGLKLYAVWIAFSVWMLIRSVALIVKFRNRFKPKIASD